MTESYNHLVYGPLVHSSYKSVEKCFNDWQQDNEGKQVIARLLGFDRNVLIDFIENGVTDKCKNKKPEEKRSLQYIWEDCFGTYYRDYNPKKLSEVNELVYLILNLDNHLCLKEPSFWGLLDNQNKDLYNKVKEKANDTLASKN